MTIIRMSRPADGQGGAEVPFYRFPLLDVPGVVHGITTRHGGVSQGPFATLNLSYSVGDAAAAVTENRRRAATALGFALSSMVAAYQVHGRHVALVGHAQRGCGALEPGTAIPACDGLLTQEPGVTLFLRFADCTPIILVDPVRRAIGLGHAGWRGAVQDMPSALVHAMEDAFGSRPSDLLAALGPAIGPCCYRVGDDVATAVQALVGDRQAILQPRGDAGWFLDLNGLNHLLLVQAGVPPSSIATADLCTACHRHEFFSHRGDGGQSGRFGVFLALQ